MVRFKKSSTTPPPPPSRPHPAEMRALRFDSNLHVLSQREREAKLKSRGLCPTCGIVETHKKGLLGLGWIAKNVDGLVYRGICLKCKSLTEAKSLLGEPVDARDNLDIHSVPTNYSPQPDRPTVPTQSQQPGPQQPPRSDNFSQQPWPAQPPKTVHSAPTKQPAHAQPPSQDQRREETDNYSWGSGKQSAGGGSKSGFQTNQSLQQQPDINRRTLLSRAGAVSGINRDSVVEQGDVTTSVPMEIIPQRGLQKDVSEISLDSSFLPAAEQSARGRDREVSLGRIVEDDVPSSGYSQSDEHTLGANRSQIGGGTAMDRLEARILAKNREEDERKRAAAAAREKPRNLTPPKNSDDAPQRHDSERIEPVRKVDRLEAKIIAKNKQEDERRRAAAAASSKSPLSGSVTSGSSIVGTDSPRGTAKHIRSKTDIHGNSQPVKGTSNGHVRSRTYVRHDDVLDALMSDTIEKRNSSEGASIGSHASSDERTKNNAAHSRINDEGRAVHSNLTDSPSSPSQASRPGVQFVSNESRTGLLYERKINQTRSVTSGSQSTASSSTKKQASNSTKSPPHNVGASTPGAAQADQGSSFDTRLKRKAIGDHANESEMPIRGSSESQVSPPGMENISKGSTFESRLKDKATRTHASSDGTMTKDIRKPPASTPGVANVQQGSDFDARLRQKATGKSHKGHQKQSSRKSVKGKHDSESSKDLKQKRRPASHPDSTPGAVQVQQSSTFETRLREKAIGTHSDATGRTAVEGNKSSSTALNIESAGSKSTTTGSKASSENLSSSQSQDSPKLDSSRLNLRQSVKRSMSESEAREIIATSAADGNAGEILNVLKMNSSSPPVVILGLEKLRDTLPIAHSIPNCGSVSSGRFSEAAVLKTSWVKIFEMSVSPHATNEVVQLEFLRTTWSIVSINQRYVSDLTSSDECMKAILKAMEDHQEAESIQEYGSGLIASLSSSHKHSLKILQVKNGKVVERLMEALCHRSQSGATQENALRAMFRLSAVSLSSDNVGPFGEVMGSHVKGLHIGSNSTNAIDAVVQSVQKYPSNAGVQIQGCQLLWRIFSEEALAEEDVLSLITSNLLKHLQSVLQCHHGCLAFHESAISLLSKISCYADKVVASGDSPEIFVKLVAGIMSAQTSSSTVALYGCRCIYNACIQITSDRFKSAAAAGSCIPIVISAMKTFPEHYSVQGEACGALASLCVGSPTNKDQVVNSDGIEQIMLAFDSYSASYDDGDAMGTKIRACTALTTLAVDPNPLLEMHRRGIFTRFESHLTEDDERETPTNLRLAMERLLLLAKGSDNEPLQLSNSATEEEACDYLMECFGKIATLNSNTEETDLSSLVSNALRLLTMFPACRNVQIDACKILALVFASEADFLSVGVREFEGITECLRENANDPLVAAAACSAIRNFCGTDSPIESSEEQVLSDLFSSSAAEVLSAMDLHHADKQVVGQASGALWALCSVKEGIAHSFASNRLFIRCLQEFSSELEVQANCIGILLSVFSVSNSAHVTSDCVECVLSFLNNESFEEETDSIAVAMTLIATVGKMGYQSQMELVAQETLIDTIVSCMFKYPNSPAIQAAACDIFSSVSLDNFVRADICSRGGTSRISAALNNLNDDIFFAKKAVYALGNLMSGAEADILRGCNASQTLLKAMETHQDDMYLQYLGISALWNLASRDVTIQTELVRLGAARIVSDSMARFVASKPVQEKGFITIWTISVPRHLKKDVGTHAIVPVMNGLAAHVTDESISSEGIGCIKCLSIEPDNKEIIEDNDIASLIFSCMWLHSDDAKVQQIALAALSNISVDVETNQVCRITSEELDAVTNAMTTHQNIKAVQESAIILLRNYTFSPSNCALLQENPGNLSTLVHAAMANFNSNFEGRAEDLLRVLPALGQ